MDTDVFNFDNKSTNELLALIYPSFYQIFQIIKPLLTHFKTRI